MNRIKEIIDKKMNRTKEILDKKMITYEELEELECSVYVVSVFNNGYSGVYYGRVWFSILATFGEYDVYI